MDDDSLTLIFAFDSDDPEFTRGVEVGRLWEILKAPDAVSEMIHATNTEMVLRMSEALGRPVSANRADDMWIEVVSAEWERSDTEATT